LNEGTTAVPRGTHPGGHTGSHADIWRLLAVIGQWLGGTIWVVFRYLVWDGNCLVVGGTLTSHAAPEFRDHHTSRS
jgi:hypothetical protein